MAFAIYCLTNRENGKRYVGQTQNLHERLRQHRNGCNKHCRAIRSAIRKYGFDSFVVSVLSEHISREETNRAERKAVSELDTLAPDGYNLRVGGHDRSGFSEESLAKMRAAGKSRGISDRCREAQKKAVTGRKLSSEQTKNMGNGWRGKKRPAHVAWLKKYWSNSVNRAAQSARAKAGWTKRRAA